MSAQMLSSYPADKVIVACAKCGMRKQYDKAAMLMAGGDRRLTYLLDDIARRAGCTKLEQAADVYDRCGAHYPELVELLRRAGR